MIGVNERMVESPWDLCQRFSDGWTVWFVVPRPLPTTVHIVACGRVFFFRPKPTTS